jgi:hypothetical protein
LAAKNTETTAMSDPSTMAPTTVNNIDEPIHGLLPFFKEGVVTDDDIRKLLARNFGLPDKEDVEDEPSTVTAIAKRHATDQFGYLPPCCFNDDGTLNRDFKFTGGKKVEFMSDADDK